jgi:hypothetical protein
LLLFNCGNLNTVTGLRVGTARELSSISDWGKRLLYCQKHANRNWNPPTVLFNWSGDKQPGREVDNHRDNTKKNGEAVVTVLTVRIAFVVSDSCGVTFCYEEQCQTQQYIKIASFCVSHGGIYNTFALCSVTVSTHSCTNYRNDRQNWAEITSLE